MVNKHPHSGQERKKYHASVCETERGRVIERETDTGGGGVEKGKSAPVLERDRPSEKARECVRV